MSFTLPSAFRSTKAQSTPPQDVTGVPAVTPEQIKSAEEDMISAGLIVEVLQDELENARKYQREARDKYIALCGKAVKQ